ncbi:hypothetical protein V8E54_003331 [Elaphomyces granulatus]
MKQSDTQALIFVHPIPILIPSTSTSSSSSSPSFPFSLIFSSFHYSIDLPTTSLSPTSPSTSIPPSSSSSASSSSSSSSTTHLVPVPVTKAPNPVFQPVKPHHQPPESGPPLDYVTSRPILYHCPYVHLHQRQPDHRDSLNVTQTLWSTHSPKETLFPRPTSHPP